MTEDKEVLSHAYHRISEIVGFHVFYNLNVDKILTFPLNKKKKYQALNWIDFTLEEVNKKQLENDGWIYIGVL